MSSIKDQEYSNIELCEEESCDENGFPVLENISANLDANLSNFDDQTINFHTFEDAAERMYLAAATEQMPSERLRSFSSSKSPIRDVTERVAWKLDSESTFNFKVF